MDDHVLVLELLCSMLRTLLDWDVVASGTTLADAARLASVPEIDVLIADACLGGSTSVPLIRSLLLSQPRVKCIVLTDGHGHCPIPEDVSQNVVAFVPKTASLGTLLSTINAALGHQGVGGHKLSTAINLRGCVTKREYEVLDALGRGLSNKEVAASLRLSVQTVETHRKSLSKKLGCSGAALIRVAVVASLTSLEMHRASSPLELSHPLG